MTDNEITKVVKELVGGVYPVGETNYDKKVLDNVTLMLNVADALICHIGNNTICNENKGLASVDECREEAINQFNVIKEHIEEYQDEYRGAEND